MAFSKTQKIIAISIAGVLGLGTIAGGIIGGIALANYLKEQTYQNAIKHLVERDHKVAYDLFSSISSYKDSIKKQDYSYQLYRIDENDRNYESIIDEIVRYKGTVNIYFDANGGTPVPSRTITERLKDNKYITETAFKSFEDFTGWNLTYGRYDKDHDQVMLKLDAQYSHHNYSIIYNLDGGSLEEGAPLHFNYYSPDITLPKPNKPGFEFTGYTSAAVTTPTLEYVIPTHTHEDVEVTANYAAKTIHVNFDAAGGECDTPSGDYVYLSDVSAGFPTATKDYYDFAGWYWNGVLVDTSSFNVSENGATLVAHYSAKTYYIYYHNMTQVELLEPLPNSFGYEDPDLQIPFVHKEGYIFCGWRIYDTSYTPDIYFTIPHNTHEDMHLEAVWLEYEADPAGVIIKDVTHDYPFLHSLRNIVLPQQIKDIDTGVIVSCFTTLWDIDVEPGSVFSNMDHILMKYDLSDLYQVYLAPRGRFLVGITEITLPSNVHKIGKSAFAGTGVRYINATNSLHYIEEGAFRQSEIVEIRHAELTHIGDYAFEECLFFSNYTITHNRSITSIGNYAFSKCSGLTEVRLLRSIRSIGLGAFANSGLQMVEWDVLNDATIGEHIFEGCDDLIHLIAHLETMENFFEQTSFNKANIEIVEVEGIGELPEQLFSGYTNLRSVSFHKSNFTVLTKKCFYDTEHLDQVILPGSVVEIGEEAFCNSAVKHVYFEDVGSLRTIGKKAFYNSGLLSLDLHEAHYLEIGEDAFKNMGSLEEVSLYAGVIENFSEVFINCPKIKKVSIWFDDYSTVAELPDGYFKDMDKLEKVEFINGSKQETGVARSLFIPRVCFSGCESLKDIDLYNLEITGVSEYSFENCRSYTNEDGLMNNLVTYPRGCFFGCTNMNNLSLEGTQEIGRYAFVSCNSLGNVYIPKTVEKLGVEAFGYTSGSGTRLNVAFTLEELAPYLLEDGGWYHWDMNCFCPITYGATL